MADGESMIRKTTIVVFTLGLLIGAIGYWWVTGLPPQSTHGELTQEIKSKVATPETRTVYIYRGAKKPLGAPKDSDVLTAVKVKEGIATAVLSAEGTTSIIISKEPIPWFRRSRRWGGSFYVGIRDSESIYRASVDRDLIQMKRAHIGVVLSADKAPSETKIFAGVGVRF